MAGPLSLEGTDEYASYANDMRRSAELFTDLVNGPRGGLRIGNKRFAIHLTFVGDGSSKEFVANVTRYAILASGANFATAPYSSGLTELASPESAKLGRIMIAASASATAAIATNNLTFGMEPPSGTWLRSTLELIRAKAIELGILGDILVGFVQAESSFTKSVCANALNDSATYGLAHAGLLTVPSEPSAEEAEAAMGTFKAAGVNVVVGCSRQERAASIHTFSIHTFSIHTFYSQGGHACAPPQAPLR